jgi:hypothetical protein
VVDGDDKVIFNHNRDEEQKRGIRSSLTQEPTQLPARAKSEVLSRLKHKAGGRNHSFRIRLREIMRVVKD